MKPILGRNGVSPAHAGIDRKSSTSRLTPLIQLRMKHAANESKRLINIATQLPEVLGSQMRAQIELRDIPVKKLNSGIDVSKPACLSSSLQRMRREALIQNNAGAGSPT